MVRRMINWMKGRIVLLIIFGSVIGAFLYLPCWYDRVAHLHDHLVITKIELGIFHVRVGPYGVTNKVDGWFVTLSDGSQWAVFKKYNVAFNTPAEYTPIVGEKLDGHLIAFRNN